MDTALRRPGARVDRELRLLSSVRHANVAAVIDSGRTAAGRLFCVTAWCQGQRLEALSAPGAMPFESARELVIQIGRAVVEVQKAIRRRALLGYDPSMGAGRILVVDDEKTVRTFTKLLLERLGFEAMEAEDGPAAIEILRAQSAQISAVLLDLTMPRMDGLETLSAIRRVAPGVPVILMSGFGTSRPDDVAGWLAPGLGPEAVLRKPYKPEELLATLQGILKSGVSARR